VALLAGFSALLAAGHIAAPLAFVTAFFAGLLTDLAHLVGQWRIEFQEGDASVARLDAGQTVLLAVRTVAAH